VIPPIAALAGALVLGVLAVRWSRGRGSTAPEPPAADAALDRRIDDELARLDS
jgi:hypothetical protein